MAAASKLPPNTYQTVFHAFNLQLLILYTFFKDLTQIIDFRYAKNYNKINKKIQGTIILL